MPGPTRYLGIDPNQFSWAIEQEHSSAFEAFVFQYLRRSIATTDGRNKVIATRRTGDKGRDIEIRHQDEVVIFGVRIAPPSSERIGVVFIECKSTHREQLDDGFLVDASQHADSECSHYFLVTNAVITPYCQYRAENEWRRRRSEFILVDRRRLYDCLAKFGMLKEAVLRGLLGSENSKPPNFVQHQLVVSVQTENDRSLGTEVVNLYISVRNYSIESQLASIALATDVSWVSDQSQLECVIDAYGHKTFHVRVTRLIYDVAIDLSLLLTATGRSQRLVIPSRKYELVLEPPFVGQVQRNLRDKLRKRIEHGAGFDLISIQGEAGVGKSRTITSALEPLKGGGYDIFHFDCDPRSGTFDLSELFRFSEAALLATEAGGEDLVEAVRIAILLHTPVVIVLEDLHHGGVAAVEAVKMLAIHRPATHAPLVIIVSGRDDHTFPNVEYYALLDLLRELSIDEDCPITIPALSEEDARILIRSVAVDLPQIAVERIAALGQSNPFVILECLQYLLDVGIAHMLSRQTIGVLDPERFAGLSGLPGSVEELYERRIAALRAADGGEKAFEFLCAASFFSPLIGNGIFNAFFDGQESHGTENLLLTRKFMVTHVDNVRIRFSHENLYHFLRRWARLPRNSEFAADIVLRHPALLARMNRLSQGELFSLGRCFPQAFELLKPIWNRIGEVTNFSSEEVDKSFYPYLEALYESSLALNCEKALVAKVPMTMGYMGIHNFPLFEGELACNCAEKMLQRLYPNGDEGLECKLAIRQLRAHALQNMGRTTEAYKLMLELEALIKERRRTSPPLEFDLYDRLQEYYRKINHPELMRHYGRLARRSVALAGDNKLMASHLITQSVSALFNGSAEALKKARAASTAARAVGIRRFVMYNRLTELIATLLYAGPDIQDHKWVYDEARSMLRDAARESFSDSIIRLQLLLATSALHAFPDTKEAHQVSRTYIAAGQSSALQFGIGLFDWAFDNLSAVLDIVDDCPDEHVRRRFRTCLERLKRRGLNHVGACGGTYPNVFAIANAVRFFGQFSEKSGVDVLMSMLFGYDSNLFSDEEEVLRMVQRACRGQPILWPEKRIRMIRYPADSGYFTPLF